MEGNSVIKELKKEFPWDQVCHILLSFHMQRFTATLQIYDTYFHTHEAAYLSTRSSKVGGEIASHLNSSPMR